MKNIKRILSTILILSFILTCSSCGYKFVKIDDYDNATNQEQDDQKNENEQKIEEDTSIKITTHNIHEYFDLKYDSNVHVAENTTNFMYDAVKIYVTITPRTEGYIYQNCKVKILLATTNKVPVTIDPNSITKKSTIQEYIELPQSNTITIDIDKNGYGINWTMLSIQNSTTSDVKNIETTYTIQEASGELEENPNAPIIVENKIIPLTNKNYKEYLTSKFEYSLGKYESNILGGGYTTGYVTCTLTGGTNQYQYKDVTVQFIYDVRYFKTHHKLFTTQSTRIDERNSIQTVNTSISGNGTERILVNFGCGEASNTFVEADDFFLLNCKINILSGYLIKN